MDYYAQIFFLQIASTNPGELCEKFYLCQSATISSRVQGNSCGFCKDTVASLLIKLNDPETKVSKLKSANVKAYLIDLSFLDVSRIFLYVAWGLYI